MCYKIETQNKNEEKLEKLLNQDNVPEFIRRYFITIKSKLGAINYWVAIKNLLVWLLERDVIKRDNISDIEPSDMLNIEAVDITLYLEEKEQKGIRVLM